MTRQIIVATVFVSGVLLALITVIQSLQMIEFVVNRGLPLSVLTELLALRMPSFFGVVLPIAFFAAILFVYNKLQDESELVIMRSAGMSEFSIARPAVIATLIMMGVSYALNLYLLPVSFGSYKNREHTYRSAYGSVMLQAGRFNTPTDTLTVYVRERVGARELNGILIRDSRDPENPLTILAQRGLLSQENNVPRVTLFDGNRQEIDSETGRLTLLYFNQYTVTFETELPGLQYRYQDPKERFLLDLLNPGDSAEDVYYHDELVAEGHRRLTEALHLPALAFIGLAFLLTRPRSRGSPALRMFGAAIAAAGLQGLSIGVIGAAARSAPLIPLLYAIPIGFLLIAVGVLWHGLWPRRSKYPSPLPAMGIEAG